MTQFDLTADAIIFRRSCNSFEVLLIQRKNNPFKDKWALPGGFVDEGELMIETAQRELFEETNLTINFVPSDFVGFYDALHRDPRKRIITFAFTKLIDGSNKLKAKDDAKGIAWKKTNDLPNLAFDHQVLINDAMKHLNL